MAIDELVLIMAAPLLLYLAYTTFVTDADEEADEDDLD